MRPWSRAPARPGAGRARRRCGRSTAARRRSRAGAPRASSVSGSFSSRRWPTATSSASPAACAARSAGADWTITRALARLGVVEARQSRFLQHDDAAGTLERMPGSRVNVEVAIEVGAGQDDDDRQRPAGARARAAIAAAERRACRAMSRSHGVVLGERIGDARPSPPARGNRASAPRCASCRCWRQRAPARRCRRAAGQPSNDDGMAEAPVVSDAARRLAGAALAEALRDARATTLARTLDRSDADWRVPQQPGINPIAWELGHLAWFAEFWILRGPHVARRRRLRHRGARGDDRRPRRDLRFGAARATASAGASRCRRAPSCVERLARQLDACIAAIPADDASDDAALYFHRLALFHEDMHGEAFAWLRAALSWPAPEGLALAKRPAGAPLALTGGALVARPRRRRARLLVRQRAAGARRARRAVRDRRRTGDERRVPRLRRRRRLRPAGVLARRSRPLARGEQAAAPATLAPRRWPLAGALVRSLAAARRRRAGDPRQRLGGRGVLPLGRPPPAERRRVAIRRRDDPRFHWGQSVWEWTADPFRPYPGFVAGPYADYSRPWFGDHRELRGGSFATHERLHSPRYRNFFTPDRSDVFAGFRTAAC